MRNHCHALVLPALLGAALALLVGCADGGVPGPDPDELATIKPSPPCMPGYTIAITQRMRLTAGDDRARGLGGALAMDGDALIAGAPMTAGDAGAAYVFDHGRTGWHRSALPRPASAGEWRFGDHVAISGDSAIVWTPRTAHVFTRPDARGSWVEEAELAGRLESWEGVRAAAIDGDVALVVTGWVYGECVSRLHVYQRTHGQWKRGQDLELTACTGWSIAMSDGLAVLADSGGSATVLVSKRGVWGEAGSLATGNDDGWYTNVAFDGDTAVIGLPGADAPAAMAGLAYVFRREGGQWVIEARLSAPEPEALAYFGWDVAVLGPVIAVAEPAFGADPPHSGTVHLYLRGRHGWGHVGTLGSETAPLGGFATALAVAPGWLIVGEPGDTTTAGGTVWAYEFALVPDPATLACSPR